MATLEQLENALRKAHAAGNADHARAFAAEIRRMRESPAPKADFSNVQGGVSSTESIGGNGFAAVPQGFNNYRPTLGPRAKPQDVGAMSTGRRVVEGANVSLERTGRGIGQALAIGADAIDGGGRLEQMKRDEVRLRAQEQPLLDTGAGKAGLFVGNVGQALIPVSRVGSATRTAQVGTGAASGAGLGFITPVTPDESRTKNTLVGLALGGVAPVAIPAAGAAVRSVTRPLSAFTQRGANTQAAGVIRRFAEDPAALTRSAPSSVPGVQRTLAQETLDPGIANLERQFPVQLADLARRNNIARTDYLAGAFGGADDAAATAIRENATRMADQTARQLRGISNQPAQANPFSGVGGTAPRQAQAITLDSVRTGIDGLIARNNKREVVQNALRYVRGQLDQPVQNAYEAWNLRKTIGDLMDGRLSGDLASARAARKELTTVRGLLDRQMNKAMPGWSEFLRNYKGAMREADQVDVGAYLLNRGGVQGVDAQGNAVRALQNGKFRNLTDDMDRTVQGATGFRRNTAAGTLTQDQAQAVGNVRDDVVRMMEADRLGRSVGSNSSQNLMTEAGMAEEIGRSRIAAVAQRVPIVGQLFSGVNEAAQRRVSAAVAEALANPQRARAILAASNPAERQIIEAVLTRAGTAGAIATPAAAQDR